MTKAIQQFNYYDIQTTSVDSIKAVYGPELPIAEKLSLLIDLQPYYRRPHHH